MGTTPAQEHKPEVSAKFKVKVKVKGSPENVEDVLKKMKTLKALKGKLHD